MTIAEKYGEWLENTKEYPYLYNELEACKQSDLHDRFYKDLEFGTGGLRGEIGAGTNRMNIFTVAKATRGLAAYLNESGGRLCAIAYDSRSKSSEFAQIAACVLAQAGIKVYIYGELMPTPMLSFAVRQLGCGAGIVITASHNPAKYNGYKVYGADGCQLTPSEAEKLHKFIERTSLFEAMPKSFYELCKNGNIKLIGPEVISEYYKNVLAQSLNECKTELSVVYSPLNGAGNKPVRHILKQIGIDVSVVSEQEHPDGSFATCPYPNPEIAQAMSLACNKMLAENADLCLATDPDCDRAAAAVTDDDGNLRLISGNEMGALLLSYICASRTENGTMPKNPLVIKTIVTTPLADNIAKAYGAEVKNVLTGFKFIGEQITELEKKGEESRFIFGFEESCGYLSGTYVRDKDAVNAAMLICEMACYYKQRGITLFNALNELYRKYGYCKSDLLSFEFLGEAGMNKMNELIDGIRRKCGNIFTDKAQLMCDYLLQETGLPKSNVISITLFDGSRLIVRPSGTEPKLKIYTTAFGKTQSEALEKLKALNKKCESFAKKTE